MVIVCLGSVQGYEFIIVAFRSAKGRVLRRVAIARHERARESMGETPHLYPHLLILLPLNLSLPFGLVPTEATIGSYRQKHSARALHRVYSVEATFGSEKRCFHRYETGGEPWPVSAASSHQLSPHWHKASGSETQEKMLHSVAEAGRGGENARRASKSIGISSLACSEMWVKMRRLAHGFRSERARATQW